jgi:hypothetical protein
MTISRTVVAVLLLAVVCTAQARILKQSDGGSLLRVLDRCRALQPLTCAAAYVTVPVMSGWWSLLLFMLLLCSYCPSTLCRTHQGSEAGRC